MPLQTAQHSVVEFNSAEPSLIDFPVDEDSSLLLPSCRPTYSSAAFYHRGRHCSHLVDQMLRLHFCTPPDLPPQPTASRRQQITSCALSLACATRRVTGHDDKRSLGTKPNHTVRYYRFRNENRISGAAARFKTRHPKTNGLMHIKAQR